MARSFLWASLLAISTCGIEHVAPQEGRTTTHPARSGAGATRAASPPVPPHWLPLEPVDGAGSGSAGAVAIARQGDRSLAFVADADDGAIVTFDLDALRPLASTPLGARPSAVLVTPTGRVVALGDDGRAHVLAMAQAEGPLVVERLVEVPDEPVSAALVPGGDTLLVASRWGHALSIVSLGGDAAPVAIDLPRDPAAVVASADGRRAFVLHAVGSRASVVDLQARSARTVSLDRKVQRAIVLSKKSMPFGHDGFMLDDFEEAKEPRVSQRTGASRPRPTESVTLHVDQAFAAVRTRAGIVAPAVEVDTGADDFSGGYGGREAAATPSVVSFDDAGRATPGRQRVFGRCLLPRGAAADAASERVFVACLGSNQVAVLHAGAHGFEASPPVRVPGGPVAVSIDERDRRAVVWSSFDRVVSILAIDGDPKVVAEATLPRSTPAPPDAVLRGRALFNASFDSRVASDGRACASCHPDARDDGLAWSSPGGRMQTPMLVERIEGTAPYGWDGAAPDLEHHLAHTTARLGGRGLEPQDVADIRAFVATLHVPDGSRPTDPSVVARGEAVFRSEAAGCAGCHAGAALTDGDTHDVQSSRHEPTRRGFDTPSLHLVAHSAPYFHDGRYATLPELLAGSDGTMGHTAQLSPGDLAALQAYLQRL
jgi:DNA-binding beta-propeller fold protein YncE